MKHYFLTAKDVGDLTAILGAPRWKAGRPSPFPMLNRVVAKLRPRGRRVLRESDDFVIDNSLHQHRRRRRVRAARPRQLDPDVPPSPPAPWPVASTPMRCDRATHSLKLIDKSLRENEEANLLFREILTSGRATPRSCCGG